MKKNGFYIEIQYDKISIFLFLLAIYYFIADKDSICGVLSFLFFRFFL